MRIVPLAAAALALSATSACVAPVGPVEVTRFHLPGTAVLGRGAISVEPAPGEDGAGLEFRSYAAAVARQLTLVGYSEQAAAGTPQVALVRIRRGTVQSGRQGGPVSVGIGGTTGSYGSGVGLGIGFNLGGGLKRMADLQLSVRIDDAATGQALWEGRALTAVPVKAPAAQPSLAAAKLAEALFKDFPGESGRTISVP